MESTTKLPPSNLVAAVVAVVAEVAVAVAAVVAVAVVVAVAAVVVVATAVVVATLVVVAAVVVVAAMVAKLAAGGSGGGDVVMINGNYVAGDHGVMMAVWIHGHSPSQQLLVSLPPTTYYHTSFHADRFLGR